MNNEPVARCQDCGRRFDDPVVIAVWVDNTGKVSCNICRARKATEESATPERFV